MNEELKKLFEGAEGFKPEFLTQISALVESKVTAAHAAGLQEAEGKFDAEIITLKESHAAELESVKESFTADLTTKLDGFLNAALLEWANENAPAIDSKLKTEMAEKLISGMAGLLGEAQIAIVGDAEGQIADLQTRLQAESQARTAAETQLQEIAESAIQAQRKLAIDTVCEGLADTQKEKVTSLLEGTSFTDLAAFSARVQRFRSLIEGKDEKDGKDKDGKDTNDGKDKDGKGKDKDEAGKELKESIAAQIAATLAYRKPVNG